MSKGSRVDFNGNSNLPKDILIDSSVLLYTVFTPSREKQAEYKLFQDAKRFLTRLEEASRKKECYPIIPLQVITECFHKISLNTMKKAIPANLDVLEQHKLRPDLIETTGVPKELDDFLKKIDIIGIEIIQPADIPDEAPFEEDMINVIEDLWLLSSDAHILTVAKRLDIKNIASLDRDFIRISRKSSFNIYTSDAMINLR